jgi:septal ring factor EnvC (AmiA/AmiB activator)
MSDVDQDMPAFCVLARKNLEEIQRAVESTTLEVQNLSKQLVSADGYIPRIHERLSLLESSAERAHARIDSNEKDIDQNKRSHNALAIKVAGFVAALVALAQFLIGKVT